MRVLVVAESPPTTDARHGNGSTLMTAQLLRHLPDHVQVDLVYFDDRPVGPDADVRERARSVRRVPLRPAWAGLLATPLTRLPRATWLRHVPARTVRGWAADADVVYLHGLHVAPLGAGLPVPVVVNEVDPWSDHWRERARRSSGLRAAYLRSQARRADRLEQAVASFAASTVLVSATDAETLHERTGGRVVAIPNGVAAPAAATGSPVAPVAPRAAFVGTLDYPPNVEALERLVGEVWPAVRARVPNAELVVAGRRPGSRVRALEGHGVRVLGAVDDVGEVFTGSRVAAYLGRTGGGTKNTVSEALTAGCPVVASPESARGHEPGAHLLVAADVADQTDLLVRFLTDDAALRTARESAARSRARSWSDAAQEYLAELERSVGVGGSART